MSLDNACLEALDDACRRAKAGERDTETFSAGEVTVGINELGGVHVQYTHQGPDRREQFDKLQTACRERSAASKIICTTPIFDPWEITFRPR